MRTSESDLAGASASSRRPRAADDAPASTPEPADARWQVLVVDGQHLRRRGTRALLDSQQDVVVVGELASAQGAAEVLARVPRLVVVLDADLPTAAEVIRAAVRSGTARVVAIGPVRTSAPVVLVESVPREVSEEALLASVRGQSTPALTAPLDLAAQRADRLTAREVEVARLVASGRRNRDIASVLYISENTVKNHVRSILEKLQAQSRVEIAALVWHAGLLDGDGTEAGTW